MKIKTKRFGEIDLDEQSVVTFKNGILGFPKVKKYVLIDPNKKSPLKWLQSVEKSDLAFVITNPLIFKQDYEIKVLRTDMEDLEVTDFKNVFQFVIVTVPHDPSKMTANMKGPILINTENNQAKQLILDDPELEIKFRLISNQKIAKAV